MTPPRVLEVLLARILPSDPKTESILGDLSEELWDRSQRRSRPLALLWYAVEGLRIAIRLRSRRGPGKRRKKRGGGGMSALFQDLKHSARALLAAPGYTGIVVGTLALGIGANAAVFSMVDALVLRPFPIPGIERLVRVWETVPALGEDRGSVAPANFLDWKDQATVFESLVVYDWWDVSLSGEGDPERLQGSRVSPDYLETLGVEPHIGRTLDAYRDDPDPRVVVLSYAFFQRRFGGDPRIVGRTIRLDGEPYEVVGVAREGFDHPYATDLWGPFRFDAQTASTRDSHYLEVIGRLRPGATAADAQAELDLVAERLRREHPATNEGRGVHVMELARAVVDMGAPAFLSLWQAATVFVLLIACANVANLLLARGADRERELSLQQALGAGRARIVRKLLTESLLLAGAGAALALPLAWIAIELLRESFPAEVRKFLVGWQEIDLDLRLLAFTAAVTFVTTILFGLVPALKASRSDLTAALREGGRGGTQSRSRQRGGRLLVIAEVALALVLLVASGLSIRGLLRITNADQGFEVDGLMTFEISLPESRYDTAEKRRRFFESVLEGVQGLPGVVSADVANVLPSSGSNTSRPVEIEGRTIVSISERPIAHFRVVSPGFFRTMGIPLLSGRAFGSGDREETSPVAIVSEEFAERHWPGADPLGRRFRTADDEPWLTVVGVVGDVLHDWFLSPEARPTFYVPLRHSSRLSMFLAVRATGEPEAVTAGVRSQVRRIDSDQPIFNAFTMRQLIANRTLGLKYASAIMGLLGLIALVLAAVGVYGLMAYSVARRAHEIGLRVALGADRGSVMRLTLGQAVFTTACGLGLGLVLAYAAGRLMAASLFGAVQLDWATFASLSFILGAVSLLSSYVPARRALSVDPAVALRAE